MYIEQREKASADGVGVLHTLAKELSGVDVLHTLANEMSVVPAATEMNN